MIARVKLFLSLWMSIVMASSSAWAEVPDEVPVDVLEVADGLYVFRPDSEIGNQTTMALVATDEVLVVDANIESSLPVILERLKEISTAPIRFVVTSHHHGDHTQGLEMLSPETVAIVPARQRERLETTSLTFEGSPPLNKAALPVLTFGDHVSIFLGDSQVSVVSLPTPQSHTDGDALVYFEAQEILYVGDHYMQDKLPLIDFSGGGSLEGFLSNLNWMLATFPETTKIVPGHGLFAPAAIRIDTIGSYGDWVDRIEAAVAVLQSYSDQGLSVDQAIEKGLGPEFANMSERPRYISEARWIKMIYPELRTSPRAP